MAKDTVSSKLVHIKGNNDDDGYDDDGSEGKVVVEYESDGEGSQRVGIQESKVKVQETQNAMEEKIEKLCQQLETIRLQANEMKSQRDFFKQAYMHASKVTSNYLKHPIKFADSRISTQYMVTNYDDHVCLEHFESTLKKSLAVIRQRKRIMFYIGATSNPDDRMRAHSKKGFSSMQLLYSTTDHRVAKEFELVLLDQVYYVNGCKNIRRTSCGLVESKRVFYVYILT